MKYKESNINKHILKSLDEMGFVDMTPIQEQAIPVLLSGRDIIGQAQTGTGKTAAFGIPMIERIRPGEKKVQGLVLCPTRELAIQAAEELKKMSKYVDGIKVVAIYGGQDIERQFRALRGNVSIVVGTPGRVMDHMRRGTLDLDNLKVLVLDEADEMLNMGFREDIEFVCDRVPEDRQTALFSATMADEILEITEEYQKDAVMVRVEQQELTTPQINQIYYIVKGREKDTSLCRLLDYMSPKRALIFCNTKRKVDQLALLLKRKGYSAEALHGDLSQHQRDRVMNLFRSGNLELLLATDVAARGIDVDDVDMVFNYDMPQDMEYYVHRIGRTGRAGKKGKAVSLITSREKYKIQSLEEYCNTEIKQKEMPSAGGAMTVKCYKNVSDAMEFCKDKDLTPYMKIVYKRCVEENLDPLAVAAAFLRMNLGEIEAEPGEDKQERRERGKDRKNGKEKKRKRNDKHDKYAEKARKSERERNAGGFDHEDRRSRGPEVPGSRSVNRDKKKGRKDGRKDAKRGKSPDRNRRHDKRGARSRKK